MNRRAKRYSNIAALALILQGALFWIGSAAITGAKFDSDSAVYFVVRAVFSAVINLIPAFLMVRVAGKPADDETKLLRMAYVPKRSDRIATTAGSAALVFAIGILYGKVFPDSTSNIPVGAGTNVWMHLLMIVSLCVFPAVCEELLFRSAIASRLAIAGKTSAVIVSALMFGLAHFSAEKFPYAFFAGIIFGSVYFQTGSVKYSMIAHFFCNFTTYLFAWAREVMTQSAYSTLEIVTLAAFLAASMLLSLLNTRSTLDAFKRGDEHADAGSVITPALAVYAVGFAVIIFLRFI